jgi:hypothetical protein
MLFIFMGKYYTVDDTGTEKLAVCIRKHVLQLPTGKPSFLDVSAFGTLVCVKKQTSYLDLTKEGYFW